MADRDGAEGSFLGVDWRAAATAPNARDGSVVAAALSLLVLVNVLNNRVLPEPMYVPTCVLAAAVLVALGRRAGLSWSQLGLARDDLGRGARWGSVAMAAVLGVLLVGVAAPPLRELFRDQRVGDDVTGGGLAYQVLWQIPLGTVVLEEIAFRSVLLGVFHRRWVLLHAVTASSALFGLWHVLPGTGLSTTNPVVASLGGGVALQVVGVVTAVISTFLAGYVFCWLRLGGRHVVASMMLHLATNTFAFALAWIVLRLT